MIFEGNFMRKYSIVLGYGQRLPRGIERYQLVYGLIRGNFNRQ